MTFEDTSTSNNAYSIMQEMQRIQTEIGRLGYRLMQLQSQLDAEYSKNGWNKTVYNNPLDYLRLDWRVNDA
jgi:hypothetical protein